MNYIKSCLKKYKTGAFDLLFSKASFPYFFTNILELEMGPHHFSMSQKITDNVNKQVFLQAARGHGKTELVSVAFPIWLLLKKGSKSPQPFQICLISATDTQMKKIMQRIKNYIEGIPLLSQNLVPSNLHTAKWNESEIITKNNVQIIGRSMSSSIRGLHVNLVILDDILTDEMANIEFAKDIFNGVIQPIVRTKKGRMVVVGTPFSFDDLFIDLWDEEMYPTATRGFYPAIDDDGRPTWESRFSLDELKVIEKNMGPIKWSREYMLRPIGSGSMLYDEQLVMSCVDKTCAFLNKTEDTEYYLGCDIALSSAKSADYSVFTVIEKNPNMPLRVVEIWRQQGTPMNEQIEAIKRLHLNYGFTKIVVEKIGLSYGLVEELQKDELTRNVTEEFITNQKNKEDILSKLHVLMKNKQLKFDKNAELITELLTFGVKKKRDGRQTYESLGKHDDMVMSLAMVCYAADQYISPYEFELI